MELQKMTLKRFKDVYPSLTFREISQLTGLETTRVFRIFNGQEMKLNEFEKFENILTLTQAKNQHMDFINITRELMLSMSSEKLEKITYKLKRELYTEKLKS